MKRIILHIHTFCLLTLLCPAGLAAQSVIRGIVIDRESQLPVEAATVQLTRGNASLPINYTLSNNEGTFILTQPKRTDSLLVSVSLCTKPSNKLYMPDKRFVLRWSRRYSA